MTAVAVVTTPEDDTMALPKYVQKANQIIETIAEEPNRVWSRTQRELGEHLGFSQPELSNLLGILQEAGRVRKGNPLPGVRGRNYAIELADATPLDAPVRKKPRDHEDRPLKPGEAVEGPVELQSLSLDQIGAAVIRSLKDTWDRAERSSQYQTEQSTKIKELREQLGHERQFRVRFASEKETLERQLEDREQQINQMRAQINQLIMTSHNGKDGNGTFKVRDMLSEDELKVLEGLMRSKPGHYKESDGEVGLRVDTK